MNCSLCKVAGCTLFFKDRHRSFYFCPACELLFVPCNEHITVEDEKKRYELHDNSPGNSGYVRFLEEIVMTVKALELKNPKILDFGSGKNMVLSGILQRTGRDCDSYDPLYEIGNGNCSKQYDILVLCEVIEHLRDLNHEIRMIKGMLEKDGVVVLRTNIYESREKFRTWWYKEDLTHINFFAMKTIEQFASNLGCGKLKQRQKNMFLLHT